MNRRSLPEGIDNTYMVTSRGSNRLSNSMSNYLLNLSSSSISKNSDHRLSAPSPSLTGSKLFSEQSGRDFIKMIPEEVSSQHKTSRIEGP